MAKILYAINGDGLGHVTRSIPIIEELSKHHNIKIVVGSKRSHEVIKKYFPKATYYEGLHFIYSKNEVDILQTIKANSKKIICKDSTASKVYKIIKNESPQVIVTDCDYLTIYLAQFFNIPLICVCNIHALTEMKYAVPKKYAASKHAMNFIVKTFTYNIDYHVITSFFNEPLKNPKKTFVFPPVLRKEIRESIPLRKEHYLVYQTSGASSVSSNNKLINILKGVNEKFIVYGFDKSETLGNITFRKTNNDQFFKDFKDCRAVIANGGYSFISEAVSLHKPVLSIPISKQFEQTLNALQVKKLGYGDMCDKLTKKKLISFIKNNDKYFKNLQHVKRKHNTELIKKIDELIRYITKK